MSFLDRVYKEKIDYIAKLKKHQKKFENYAGSIKKKNYSKNPFFKAVSRKNRINIIAEIKKSSPSKGKIVKNMSHLKIAKIYSQSKAAAVSILTDKNFSGHIKLLKKLKLVLNKPILRKDFIIDELMILESLYNNADAILLIAAMLTKKRLSGLFNFAKNLGLESLIEIHSKPEIKKIPENARIIGINNRNLKTLKININNSIRLRKHLPENKTIVVESGISSKEDINFLKNKINFNAVLIGTGLLENSSGKNILERINNLT